MTFAAVELAEKYGISMWIRALLDKEEITHGTSPGKLIRSPPEYKFKEMANGGTRSPEKKATEGRKSTRGRRSASVLSEDPESSTLIPKYVAVETSFDNIVLTQDSTG